MIIGLHVSDLLLWFISWKTLDASKCSTLFWWGGKSKISGTCVKQVVQDPWNTGILISNIHRCHLIMLILPHQYWCINIWSPSIPADHKPAPGQMATKLLIQLSFLTRNGTNSYQSWVGIVGWYIIK